MTCFKANLKLLARLLSLMLFSLIGLSCASEKSRNGDGKLFIIGGGERSPALVGKMMDTAEMNPEDYVFVLPMASSIPDTTALYISEQIREHGNFEIKSHNFSREDAAKDDLIQQVLGARLIYIPGGDQNRFMQMVADTPLFDAIHTAYQNGATIAGTSAGAAVMSKIMLTGEQKLNSNEDGVDVLWKDNIDTGQGLGFLDADIIDQHFIRRSRFNRLISLVVDYPDKQGIGIDEGTAIICHKNKAEVVGDGQVVVVSRPEDVSRGTGHLFSFEDLSFSLYKDGDSFSLFSGK